MKIVVRKNKSLFTKIQAFSNQSLKLAHRSYSFTLKRLVAWLELSWGDIGMILLGNLIMSFAIVNIHIPAKITEGGVIGLSIVLSKLTHLSPGIINLPIDILLYGLGVLLLKEGFFKKAIFSTLIYVLMYSLVEAVGPVLPSLEHLPVVAAILGGLLLGIGCGLVVSRGCVAGGDDCYALIVANRTSISLGKAYFLADILVLTLSVILYMPLVNGLISLLTTFISSFIIGQFEVEIPTVKVEVSRVKQA